jgi:hypothetical protein
MTTKQALAFMKNVDANAPFWVELHDENRKMLNINNNDVPRCLYNLMLTKRDIRLYADYDMKPNRHWKISDVKKYFGLKGGKGKIKDAIFTIHDEFIGRIENQDNDTTEND